MNSIFASQKNTHKSRIDHERNQNKSSNKASDGEDLLKTITKTLSEYRKKLKLMEDRSMIEIEVRLGLISEKDDFVRDMPGKEGSGVIQAKNMNRKRFVSGVSPIDYDTMKQTMELFYPEMETIKEEVFIYDAGHRITTNNGKLYKEKKDVKVQTDLHSPSASYDLRIQVSKEEPIGATNRDDNWSAKRMKRRVSWSSKQQMWKADLTLVESFNKNSGKTSSTWEVELELLSGARDK